MSQLYCRNLSVYKFTIYDQVTKDGFAYVWDETNGQRGSSEIGICFVKHILSLPKKCKHVSFFSNSCGGQNCNQFVVGAMHYALSKGNVSTIDLKFLVPGHTAMEVDSMLTAIEKSKKYQSEYSRRLV